MALALKDRSLKVKQLRKDLIASLAAAVSLAGEVAVVSAAVHTADAEGCIEGLAVVEFEKGDRLAAAAGTALAEVAQVPVDNLGAPDYAAVLAKEAAASICSLECLLAREVVTLAIQD